MQDKENKNFYYGFEVGFELDTSDIVYTKQYRLQKAEVYILKNSRMVKTGLVALTGGESEFVYKIHDKVDFTGGYHGDELLTTVKFYLDGKELSNLDKPFSLLAGESFKYVQVSTMHETASIDKYTQLCGNILSLKKMLKKRF